MRIGVAMALWAAAAFDCENAGRNGRILHREDRTAIGLNLLVFCCIVFFWLIFPYFFWLYSEKLKIGADKTPKAFRLFWR